MLEIENLYYRYPTGSYEVIKDLSYSFERGRLYAITGSSGTGKSTLLMLMANLLKPTSGVIMADGTDIRKINPDKYRSRYVNVIFQQFNLISKLSAADNISLALNISTGASRKTAAVTAIEALEQVGIDREKALRPVCELSGGEMQRTAIARAMCLPSPILLADEPTGNLDTANRDKIFLLLSDLAHNMNKCVIVVSHDPAIEEIAYQSAELANGELIKIHTDG